MLAEVVLFVAGTIGLAHVLVDGKICKGFRDWLDEPAMPGWAPRWLAWFLKCCGGLIPGRVHSLARWFVRKNGEMIRCHQCTGLWAGLLVGWLAFSHMTWWQWAAAGFAGSFLSMSAAIYYNYLEAQTIMTLPAEDKPAPPESKTEQPPPT